MKLFNRIICFFIGHKPYRVKWTNSFYIKEFYVNDMCIDINTNTIQNTESLNVKNC